MKIKISERQKQASPPPPLPSLHSRAQQRVDCWRDLAASRVCCFTALLLYCFTASRGRRWRCRYRHWLSCAACSAPCIRLHCSAATRPLP